MKDPLCFGSIQNNIALKPSDTSEVFYEGFGSIQNNIALKLTGQSIDLNRCFGSIQNNIALKQFHHLSLE